MGKHYSDLHLNNDTDRFNLSSDKSSGLTFIVKKSQY